MKREDTYIRREDTPEAIQHVLKLLLLVVFPLHRSFFVAEAGDTGERADTERH